MEDIILKIETERDIETQKISDPETSLEVGMDVFGIVDDPAALKLKKKEFNTMYYNYESIDYSLNRIKDILTLIDLINVYFECYGKSLCKNYIKVWVINEKTNEKLYFKEWKNEEEKMEA